MAKGTHDSEHIIHPEMTILDVISRYRQTEPVFRKYDKDAGVCLCCEALFDPLRKIARKYSLNLKKLISDLEDVAILG